MQRLQFLFSCGAIAVCLSIAGCGKQAPTAPSTSLPSFTPDPDPSVSPWILRTNQPDSGPPALLWNGLLGVRVSRSGSGLDSDGKPLGFFSIDDYDPKGSEGIVTLPNPLLVTWSVGNQIYDGNKAKDHDFIKSGGTPLSPTGVIQHYSQSLDMRNGVLTTRWNQLTDAAGQVQYQCETVIHPTERVLAQRWTVHVAKPTTFSVKSLDYSGPTDNQENIGGDSAQSVILTASKSRAVTLVLNLSGANAGARVSVGGFRIQEGTANPDEPVVFERVLAFGPHSPSPLPEFSNTNVGLLRKVAPRPTRFQDVLHASVMEWAKRWRTDIEIDGPVADQRAIHSFLYYLQSSIAPGENRSVSPFGLSNSKYQGHVFWDADVWVLPAIDLLYPNQAKSIANYRLGLAPAAERNFSQWFASRGTPNGIHAQGVKYPWESSLSGTETAPGASKIEDHITGSVVWGETQAAALGLAPEEQVNRLASLAANYYSTRGNRVKGSPSLAIEKVMSPDENHTGDNDLYTNLLANWIVGGRSWPNFNPALPSPPPTFALPHDSKGLISYDGDRFKGYKQAAAVMSVYPLQYPPAETKGLAMVDRFEPGVIKNGPAMTDSLHALIRARGGDVQKAYSDWEQSWDSFTKNPFMLFCEKRNQADSYFVTGAAGCLQTVLYGFLGFRVDSHEGSESLWRKSLMGKFLFTVTPHLPPKWKSVKVKRFNVMNSLYTVVVTHQGVQVLSGG